MAFDLNSISKTTAMKAPFLTIYGSHGEGKTTLAAGAPNPIFAFTEDGAGKLHVNAFPMIKSFDDMLEAIATIKDQEHDFQSFIVDSIDQFEPLVWEETCRRNNWANIETPGYGKGFVAANQLWREFLDALLDLRNAKGMVIILLAHCEVKKFEDPTVDPYDRFQIKLHKAASALVQELSDAVLFLRKKVVTKQTDAGFGKKTTRGVGTGQRILFTEEAPSHNAKNRYSLPPEIQIPKEGGWQILQQQITG